MAKAAAKPNVPSNPDIIPQLEARPSEPAQAHALVSARLLTRIAAFVEKQELGTVTAGEDSAAIITQHVDSGAIRQRTPDVAFISKARRIQNPDKTYAVPPDLAVEVITASDTYMGIRRMVRDHFAHGVREVWIVYPQAHSVEVFRNASDDPLEVAEHGTLEGGDILPGFSLSLDTLFSAIESDQITRSKIIEQMQQSPMFKGVAREELEALLRLMRSQSYSPGQMLFRKGDAGDSMYILVAGRVRIYTTDMNGNQITLAFAEPTRVFGDFSLLDQQPRSASAVAMDQITVLILRREDFLSFLPKHTGVGMAMVRNLADNVRNVTTFLSRVNESMEQLAVGEYDAAIYELEQSGSSPEVKRVVEAFIQMVHQVRERERLLGAAGASKASQ